MRAPWLRAVDPARLRGRRGQASCIRWNRCRLSSCSVSGLNHARPRFPATRSVVASADTRHFVSTSRWHVARLDFGARHSALGTRHLAHGTRLLALAGVELGSPRVDLRTLRANWNRGTPPSPVEPRSSHAARPSFVAHRTSHASRTCHSGRSTAPDWRLRHHHEARPKLLNERVRGQPCERRPEGLRQIGASGTSKQEQLPAGP